MFPLFCLELILKLISCLLVVGQLLLWVESSIENQLFLS